MKKGEKIGQRIIVNEPYRKGHNKVVDLKCLCGKISSVSLYCLNKGIGLDLCRNCKASKHGMSGSPEFSSWTAMKRRCNDPKNSSYKHYGGKGIKVCKRWSSFKNFYSDMGDRPKGTSLDRIDNNKNYSPSNCRWSSLVEQANNQRTNLKITFNGETLSAAQWDRRYKLKPKTVARRYRSGVRGKKLFVPMGSISNFKVQK